MIIWFISNENMKKGCSVASSFSIEAVMIAISSVLKTFVSASVALSWQSDTAQCKSSVNVADTWLTSLMALQILLELLKSSWPNKPEVFSCFVLLHLGGCWKPHCLAL